MSFVRDTQPPIIRQGLRAFLEVRSLDPVIFSRLRGVGECLSEACGCVLTEIA